MDAIHFLALEQLVPVPRINAAAWVIGRAGDNRHIVAHLDPLLAVLEGARRRRIDLGREIVGEKENPHRSHGCCPGAGRGLSSVPSASRASSHDSVANLLRQWS